MSDLVTSDSVVDKSSSPSPSSPVTLTSSAVGKVPPVPPEKPRLLRNSFRRDGDNVPERGRFQLDKTGLSNVTGSTSSTFSSTPSLSTFKPNQALAGGSAGNINKNTASSQSYLYSNGDRLPSPPKSTTPQLSVSSTTLSLLGSDKNTSIKGSGTSAAGSGVFPRYASPLSSAKDNRATASPMSSPQDNHMSVSSSNHDMSSSTSTSPGGSVGAKIAAANATCNKESLSPKPTSPLNAKREAFYKMEPSAPKFDPSARLGGGLASLDRDRDRDRERHREREAQEPEKHVEKHVEKSHIKDNHVKEIEGYVGFANLPNQVYRKSVKKGFEFTLMVVGESGLGKSTLINSLFLCDLYSPEYPGPSHRIQKTVKVDTTHVVLKENGVQLRLTTVDTPGFGDAVDNSNCWQPVIDYINSKYMEYLTSESRVNRTATVDNRVHCCLYFIAPTGHGLKPLDVEFMKRLHDKVNIIPMIAKADTMTPDECRDFKRTILNEIAQHKIKIYEFPDADDDEENKHQKKLKDRVPFAVVGSNALIDTGGKKIRGRQYPWGTVEVENLEHNDFIALRNMLIRTHMQDLKDVTNNVHYENYRYSKLAPSNADGKVKQSSLGKDPITQMHEEKKEHEVKMKKMEAEMEQVFEMKVKEKRQKLKDSEADLQKRAEQMKKSLELQQRELDDKWRNFEREKASFEESVDDKQSEKKKNKKSIF